MNNEENIEKILVKSIYYPEGVEVETYKIINFIKPILGFDSLKRFCILNINKEKDIPFFILQSVDDERLCFIIADPNSFFSDYSVPVLDEDKKLLNVNDKSDAIIFVIANLSKDLAQSTVNLKAPVIINTKNKTAIQIVLNNDDYQVKQRLPIAKK